MVFQGSKQTWLGNLSLYACLRKTPRKDKERNEIVRERTGQDNVGNYIQEKTTMYNTWNTPEGLYKHSGGFLVETQRDTVWIDGLSSIVIAEDRRPCTE